MPPRQRVQTDLEENLYANRVGSTVYYKYRHPITKKFSGLGSSKKEAMRAARKLNSLLVSEDNDSLVNKVLGLTTQTVGSLVERYKEERLADKTLAASTKQSTIYRIERIRKDLGDRIIEEITTLECAKWLDKNFERDAYTKHRGTLIDLFRFAITKGYRKDNPAEPTYAKQNIEKDRQRMTLEQYRALHAAAPLWMKGAMEIALITLQGRYEVCNMKYSDIQDDALYVVREKVKGKEWSRLKIKITPELSAVIKRSRESGIACPYIIHRKPKRIKPSKKLDHWAQIAPDQFGKEFKKLRDSVSIFDSIPMDNRPTFHEIRALGSWLYEEAGFDTGYVQKLMAHGDKEMTEYYQSGHTDKWVSVEAGLSLTKIFGK